LRQVWLELQEDTQRSITPRLMDSTQGLGMGAVGHTGGKDIKAGRTQKKSRHKERKLGTKKGS
jgi:hypothetical protein